MPTMRIHSTNCYQAASNIKSIIMYGPAKETEINDMSHYITDGSLLRFYRFTSGCIVENENGKIYIISATQLLIDLSKRKGHVDKMPIGYITNIGELYINSEGNISLFMNGDCFIAKNSWNNIEELLSIDFS